MDYLKIVEDLNQDMYDKYGETEEQWFYTSSGFVDIIGFGEIILWCSELDDREWIEDINNYEPLAPYLKIKLRNYGKNLIKLSNC